MTQVATVPEENKNGITALEQARAFVITTPEQYLAVDAFCVNLKALEKEVGVAYDDHIADAHAAHKALVAKKAKYAEPIVEARKIAKGKLIAWDDEQAKLRKIEEDRIRAENQKKADDEALDKAARAAEFGDHEAAEAAIAEPVIAAPVKIAPEYKAQTVTQTRWQFEITDASLIPKEYLKVDEVKLGGVVRATKGSINIPGVRVYSVKV